MLKTRLQNHKHLLLSICCEIMYLSTPFSSTDQLVASRAQLPLPNMQTSASHSSASSPPGGLSALGPPLPTAAPSSTTGGDGTTSDSTQDPAQQAKFLNALGYPVPPAAPSFSYNVLSNPNSSSDSLQHSSSCPPVASQGGKSAPNTAASLQPPVPGQSAQPNSFIPGAPANFISSPFATSVCAPSGASSNVTGFSFNGNSPLKQNDPTTKSETGTLSSTPSFSPSFSQHGYTASSTPTVVSSSHNVGLSTLRMPAAPSFHVPLRMSGSPVTPGPPGISSSVPQPLSLTAPSATTSSSSSALPRPIVPVAPVSLNLAAQHQTYPSYPSVPPAAAPSHGAWFPSPHLSGLARPPFVQHPASFSVPFPLPPRGMPLPSIPLPDAQPPGVTPVGPFAATLMLPVASVSHLTTSSGVHQYEAPPGTDNIKHVNDVGIKGGAATSGVLDAWTAHKTETGVVYYYNALTGESTYEKPAGYKGEPDKVTAQPTPVSWEKVAGTDWTLVTTDDGKKYYYNSKTKLSSWQIPDEVTDLGKKQDADALKEQPMSVPNTNLLTDKGSASINLSAPAVNTGGRDATALRSSGQIGSSSALDLIKRKLQDTASPATSPVPALSGPVPLEANGSKAVEATVKFPQSENNKDKIKDTDGDVNMSDSSSDSEDVESGPTKEECIIQFKEMLKERGVAPFSKWEKELPKIVFDPRFKAIQGHSARRALFEHYVRTRAEEERKEKRAAHKAAVEGFKLLLEDAKEDIDHNTDYQTFKKKWGYDPRFEVLERKDRELLLNERVLPLKKAAVEKAQAIRAAATSSFKSMLRENAYISSSSRWSKVKDSLRSDPRYKSVQHEDREILFNEYLSELKLAEEEAERAEKAKQEEQEKLKERERTLRKRKEREEQEVERVRSKARRKEAIESYQALLVETIKDPRASWTESKPKLEKDPQGRAASPYLDHSDFEKLFREHIKILHERCAQDFKALLSEILTPEVASKETEDGKTASTSWSTAKRLLKADTRYAKMPRKERESLWRRHIEEMQVRAADDQEEREKQKHTPEARSRRRSVDYGKSGRF